VSHSRHRKRVAAKIAARQHTLVSVLDEAAASQGKTPTIVEGNDAALEALARKLQPWFQQGGNRS
jgi:translation initiation factor 1 (eIF-1/SUI1)